MFQFTSMELTDRIYFKKQSFDFSRPGIKLILGKNLRSSSQNTNAVGKSFFFSQLPEFLTNEVLHGNSRDQVRTGSTRIHGKDENHLYTFERSFSPTEKITIWRDGEDLGIHRLPDARAMIQKIIPYTEQEVHTFLFLDSHLPHPLISGDTSSRKAFFTSFFRLGSLRNIRKAVSASLNELRASKLLYTDLRERLTDLRSKEDPELPQKKLRLARVTAASDDLQVVLKQWLEADSIRKQMHQFKDCLELMKKLGLETEDDVRAHLKSLKSLIREATAGLHAWEHYRAWSKESPAREADLKELAERGFDTKAQVAARIAFLRTRVTALNKKCQEAEGVLSERESSLRSIKSEEAELKTSRDRVQRSLKQLREAETTCPTCGSEYDNKHAKKEIASANASLSKIEARLSELTSIRADLPDSEEWSQHIESLEKKIKLASDEASELSSLMGVYDLSPPEKPVRSEEDFQSLHDESSSESGALSRYEDALEVRNSWRALTREVRSVTTEKFQSKQEEHLRLVAERSSLEVAVSASESVHAELVETRKKLRPLKEALADRPALELLEAAFSSKGVESDIIRSICSMLQKQVNAYAKLIFPEDYRFEFELETQFSIRVIRGQGKLAFPSDVRKLSGAERKLFSLVLLVALLSFVPKSRRTSLLILDEPTAAMGPENIASFIRFLPILQKVIPTIVVITPLEPSHYLSINPEVFTVVKERSGVARIVKGLA